MLFNKKTESVFTGVVSVLPGVEGGGGGGGNRGSRSEGFTQDK
ncbi:MAG: hypothetical protein QOK91_08720 [Nitrososphaeraceae archaeon]|nr:hypothetical protein [Nitrososphaeraceae archaeon]